MIRFESVKVTPSTLSTKGPYRIQVKAVYERDRFKFPLSIPKLIGIIFRKNKS